MSLLGLGAAVLGGALLGSKSKSSSQPKAPKRMSYEEAMTEAENALRPQYERNRRDVLKQIDTNLISKGFYGQAPGDQMKSNTMGDMASDYQGQKAQFATNLRNNQYGQDYQAYQTQLQQANQPDPFWSTVGSLAGSFVGGPGGSQLFNWLVG